MMERTVLVGWRYSLYSRIARVSLLAKAVEHVLEDTNPFDTTGQANLQGLHPFGRVPVLRHGRLVLYETAAITRYVDAGFQGPSLTPADPVAMARMAQVIAVIDAYGYLPMIRYVFAPFEGLRPDEALIAKGLAAAVPVLTALEAVAREGLVLRPEVGPTLADCHLAPTIDYFCRAAEGAELVARFPALSCWWGNARDAAALRATDPDPGLPAPH